MLTLHLERISSTKKAIKYNSNANKILVTHRMFAEVDKERWKSLFVALFPLHSGEE
jgi:hypothetical protein